jgi:hypothetical protein
MLGASSKLVCSVVHMASHDRTALPADAPRDHGPVSGSVGRSVAIFTTCSQPSLDRCGRSPARGCITSQAYARRSASPSARRLPREPAHVLPSAGRTEIPAPDRPALTRPHAPRSRTSQSSWLPSFRTAPRNWARSVAARCWSGVKRRLSPGPSPPVWHIEIQFKISSRCPGSRGPPSVQNCTAVGGAQRYADGAFLSAHPFRAAPSKHDPRAP